MSFCPNCGANLPDNATFCTNCGNPIGSVPAGGYAPPTHLSMWIPTTTPLSLIPRIFPRTRSSVC